MSPATKGVVIPARGVNEVEEERHGEKRAASEKAIPIAVSESNQQINNYRDQVGSVPFTGSSSAHQGSHNSSAYDYYSDDGSFRSGGGGFPSSFRNSNYPSSLSLLTTTTAEENTNSNNYTGLPSTDDTTSPAITSYDPTPALSRMNFETGSYDTCAEYLTHSAMTRHAENYYQQHRTKNPAKPSTASPALNNTPHSYYGSNYTPPQPSSNHTHAHYKDHHKQQHYHGNNEVHNMSMELTFENSNLPSYGLAGTVPFTSSTTSSAAEYQPACGSTADHMDEFEPFEFLQHCDSSMSPRQPAASNSNTEQSAPRFSIPLL